MAFSKLGTPFLSVVMPVHDGEAWITPTLESLAAETLDDVEIVAIDSSPGSGTGDLINSYADRLPVRIFQRRDLDRWQTKTNFGIEQANADHVCMLHQDDVWLPGRVAAVRRWLASAPDAVLHLAPTRIIDRNGKVLGQWTCPLPGEKPLAASFLLERLLVQNFISVLAPVFRRSAWRDCGGVDASLWYTADWDLWLKLANAGCTVYHQDMTTGFRIHGSSLTVTGSRDPAEFRAQMETVLDRHIGRVSPAARRRVEAGARASIDVNVSLAAASAGNWRDVARSARQVLSLGPTGVRRYLRDSRIRERVMPRVRAKLSGAF